MVQFFVGLLIGVVLGDAISLITLALVSINKNNKDE